MLNDSNKTRDSVQNIILFFIDVLGVLIAYYVSGMAWLFVYKNMALIKQSFSLVRIWIPLLLRHLSECSLPMVKVSS